MPLKRPRTAETASHGVADKEPKQPGAAVCGAASPPLVSSFSAHHCDGSGTHVHAASASAKEHETLQFRHAKTICHNDETEPTTSGIVLRGGMVRLNVGGEFFVVHKDTLLYGDSLQRNRQVQRSTKLTAGGKGSQGVQQATDGSGTASSSSSYFSRLLEGDAATPVDVDGDGAILIDRDPLPFSIIVNYLRGYQTALNIPPTLRSMVAQDAVYYGLAHLAEWLKEPDRSQYFAPGAGISPEGRRFRPTYAISFVGDRFLLRGRHSITFEILSAEYLGLGVVSDQCVGTDVEFHKTLNCCVYYMTGVFYSNFPSQRKEELLERYMAGDMVTLHLDMNAKLLEFVIHGVSKLVSVKSATRLRFGVALRHQSGVRIVSYTSTAE